ncbi:U3 snoRNP protein [Tieghemostelium lacteum]|uniref:U3 snoRNP protein n=1 Tax=Tieghemostelium lacteum TaxID=361077 RepID=A0A151ZET8_TIELA|nr:U3 snoRNP protein [Tieghemostelium lacteum]|eukprot:KYQ92482.1 U3 snoRNP protein [Tieghemostelium lacteum]
MVSNKRKLDNIVINQDKDEKNKKNKVVEKQQQDAIMAMASGYDNEEDIHDSDEEEEENVVSFNNKYYTDDNDDDEVDDDSEGDFIDGDDDEEQLDDSEAVVGRSTILPEKNDSNNSKFKNLRVKSLPKDQQSKAPTSEEITELRNTQDLFNSNLFRLQVNELFKEIKVDYIKLASLETALHQLKTLIEKIPDQQVDVYKNSIENVKVFDLTGSAEDLKIQFSKPSSIEIVGSFMTQTVHKNNLNVDLLLEIPSETITAKDANDFKYFTKRNLYLWTLYKEIQKHQRFQNVTFQNFQGDSNKQILVVQPSEDPLTGVKTKFQIRILLTVSKDLFKIYSKFNPTQNCLLSNNNSSTTSPKPTLNGMDDETSQMSKKELMSTPYYNNAILEDMFYYDHMSFIHERIDNAPVLKDTILLLKSWLELKMPLSSVNGFHLTMLLCHLYTLGKVNKSMSCYQAFRVAMVYISKEMQSNKLIQLPLDKMATDDFSKQKITKEKASHNPYEDQFKRLYAWSLVDSSGLLNITSRVTPWDLRDLKYQAKKTLSLLDLNDSFEEIFLKKYHFFMENDYMIQIKLGKDQFDQSLIPQSDYWQSDKFIDHYIMKLLKRSLTKRVVRINIQRSTYHHDSRWTKEMPDFDQNNRLVTVGLIIDPVNWLSLIDMGPPADHVSAAVFQKFWGKKSQLRRFKDGSILEAVAWTPKDNQRHLVILDIVKYILGFQFKVPENNVTAIIDQFDPLLYGNTLLEDKTILAIQARDELAGIIRSLGLPLGIENFSLLSPGARYTGVCQTLDHNYQSNEPLEMLMIFESSSSWTYELDSIYALKTAFLLKIARELEETEHRPQLTRDYIEVFCNGFLFRLIPFYQKEIEISREQGRLELATSLERLQRLGTHHSYIQSLHTSHPSYGPTTKLVLRWVHSHLFSGHIDQITIELLVASLYSNPMITPVPQTPIMGFLRFLYLLSTHSWSERALVIDYQGNLNSDQLRAIQLEMDSQKQSPSTYIQSLVPLMYLATERDKKGEWFKSTSIKNPIILQRLIQFARISIEKIENLYKSSSTITNNTPPKDWVSIFLDENISKEYDVIFNLNENLIPNYSLEINNIINKKQFTSQVLSNSKTTTTTTTTQNNSKSIFKNLMGNKNTKSTMKSTVNSNSSSIKSGFNPIEELLKILNFRFSEYCLFFYDAIGGNVLTLKWLPAAFEPSSLKPKKSKYATPCESPQDATKKEQNSFVLPNLLEIIQEINHIGGKFIKSHKLLSTSLSIMNKYKINN